jgi:POT family proton-dependent oligopeptide transporter
MTPAAVATPSAFEARYGHPPGLFVLFFAEMWERFSYYGMRALLVLYMTKGFLGYGDVQANDTYGAYTSLVYMTPFFGGLLADRVIGQRRSVLLGGALMAAGHLLMTWESQWPFFFALALLIAGNGFFKPNISTIVGDLYPAGDGRRDSGFTLFYMGINLGAALAPLVCGYVGETFGWHYGFGLATLGMMVGLAVFVAPRAVTQVMIMATAVLTALGMLANLGLAGDWLMFGVNLPVAIALVLAAGVAWQALTDGGVPDSVGHAKDEARAAAAQPLIVGGVLLAVPVFALLVSRSAWAEVLLNGVGLVAFSYLVLEAVRSEKVERERMFVVLVMTFFSMLFWAFFEQAGSSMSLFTDRNVDRLTVDRVLTADDVGEVVPLEPSQGWLGFPFPTPLVAVDGLPSEGATTVMTIDRLDKIKARLKDTASASLDVPVSDALVGMPVAAQEVPASVFQAANPTFILLFGLLFTMGWNALSRRGLEPSTPVKFALGLAQLGLGFYALYVGASSADPRGMVGMHWLLLAYLLHTTGELCLSPVGLSMVTRLSPARLVSTTMGAWFLATAFSQLLAAKIANVMAIGGHGEEAGPIPPPIETVAVYGDVFEKIAYASMGAAALMLLLSPILVRWAHEDALAPAPKGGH